MDMGVPVEINVKDLKNREEKTREAKNRFLGLSVFYKKSCTKDKIIFKNLKNKNTNGF